MARSNRLISESGGEACAAGTLAACLAAMLLWTACGASADEVKVLRMPAYGACSVTGFKDGLLSFTLASSGVTVSKSVADIERLTLTGHESFNKAESLLASGKPADAVAQYDLSAERATDPWLKDLIACRRLAALKAAGLIARATEEWLAIADRMEGSAIALALRPAKVAKGEQQNDKAIAILEARLPKLDKQPKYADAARQLLLDLYTAQGQSQKAAAIAGLLASATAAPTPAPTAGPTPGPMQQTPRPAASEAGAQLRGLEFQVTSDPAKALATLKAGMESFSAADLPKALLLEGRAQVALEKQAKSAVEKRQLLVEAGLNFMRVGVFFSSSAEAPEAMYQCGVINLQLGNQPAAKLAFQKVVDNWQKSEFAKKAGDSLAKLK